MKSNHWRIVGMVPHAGLTVFIEPN